MTPAMILRGRPGEKIEGFSPAMPNAEWFPYWRQLVRILGQHLGLSLEQMLFDTENTTFHGYRGALLEAQRKGYRSLAITNVVGSTIARESSGGIYQHAGPEIGVAHTEGSTALLSKASKKPVPSRPSQSLSTESPSVSGAPG